MMLLESLTLIAVLVVVLSIFFMFVNSDQKKAEKLKEERRIKRENKKASKFLNSYQPAYFTMDETIVKVPAKKKKKPVAKKFNDKAKRK